MRISFASQLGRSGGGVSAATAALLAAMDSPVTDPGLISAINSAMALVQAHAAKLRWFMHPLHDAQASRINWLNPSEVATNTNSLTFTANSGWSNEVSGERYLHTVSNLSTAGVYAQNSAHIGFSVFAPPDATNSYLIVSASGGVTINPFVYNRLAVSGLVLINSAYEGSSRSFGDSDGIGNFGVSRTASDAVQVFLEGTAGASWSNVASTSVVAQPMRFGTNLVATGLRLGGFHFGTALNAAEFSDMADAMDLLKAEDWA